MEMHEARGFRSKYTLASCYPNDLEACVRGETSMLGELLPLLLATRSVVRYKREVDIMSSDEVNQS